MGKLFLPSNTAPFNGMPQQLAPAPATAAVPPSEHESEAGSEFDAVRLRRLRDFLQETDVENRLAGCVEQMLSGEELPWNPYPSLVRLLRLAMAVRGRREWRDHRRLRASDDVPLEPDAHLRL